MSDDDNVTILPVVTTLAVPVDRVLKKALDNGLKSVIVIGITDDGEFWFSASEADGGDVLWWLEVAKKRLMADV